MDLPYVDRVRTYGRHWHRPWLAFLAVCAVLWGIHALTLLEQPRKFPVATAACEPRPDSRYRPRVDIAGLPWTADIEAALACGARQGRRVFVAFSGVSNANAKLNEVHAFPDATVKSALDGYILLMVYIDRVPDQFYRRKPEWEDARKDGEDNQKFQVKHFQDLVIPLYAVVQPKSEEDFEIIGRYAGRIVDVDTFVRFLRDPAAARQESE